MEEIILPKIRLASAKTMPKMPIMIPATDMPSKYPRFFLEIMPHPTEINPKARLIQEKKKVKTEDMANKREITDQVRLFCFSLLITFL